MTERKKERDDRENLQSSPQAHGDQGLEPDACCCMCALSDTPLPNPCSAIFISPVPSLFTAWHSSVRMICLVSVYLFNQSFVSVWESFYSLGKRYCLKMGEPCLNQGEGGGEEECRWRGKFAVDGVKFLRRPARMRSRKGRA